MQYGRDTFVVRVEDNRMAPRFNEGDFVFVDPDEPAVDGCFVGIRHDDGRAMTIRRFTDEGGRRLLRTMNPDYIECELDAKNETMICGVAVFVVRRV